MVVSMPGILARTEGPDLGDGLPGPVLEIVCEEAGLDFLAELRTRGLVEIDEAKAIAGAHRPATMVPGANDQEVLGFGVVLLEGLIDLQGAEEVLLVPPAGDVQGGHLRPLQVGAYRLLAPE